MICNKKNIFSKYTIFFFDLILVALFSQVAKATERYNPLHTEVYLNKVQRQQLPSDSVLYYTRGTDGLIVMPKNDWAPFPSDVSFRDTVIYDPAFLPVVFDGKILPPNLDFLPKDSTYTRTKFYLISPDSTLVPLIQKNRINQNLRRDFYMDMNNIGKVRYSAATLKSIPKFDEENLTKTSALHDLIAVEEPIRVSPFELPKQDPRYIYWTKNGEHSLQVAQNYISKNWYKGGNSNFFIRNYHKIGLNYNRNKVSFANILEWKLNVQQTPADSLHNININDDLLRLESTFGYKAYDNWSYSTKLEAKTQLFNSYPINSKDKNTSFLSPFTLNVGIGMSYNLNKSFENDITKKVKFSLNLSPLSLNYIYVRDETIQKIPGGIEPGDHSNIEFGSLINSDLTFNFNRFMTLTSRLKYFTNYERAELEFENKFDMSLNRFLSTSFYVYMRFDDNAQKESGLGYFQMNELLSFGLNYKW